MFHGFSSKPWSLPEATPEIGLLIHGNPKNDRDEWFLAISWVLNFDPYSVISWGCSIPAAMAWEQCEGLV